MTKSSDSKMNPSGNMVLSQEYFNNVSVNEEARIIFDWNALLRVVIPIQTYSL